MPPSKRILIADDESMARDRIRRFLQENGGPFEIAEARNGLEALDLIATFAPDTVFLDIQMPGLTGFEVLRCLPKRDFQVIFQTAYDEFALKAFDESACDYLLKPFSRERFEKALRKAADQKPALTKLETGLKKADPYPRRLTFKQSGKTRVLDLDQTLYFYSEDHCTFARMVGGAEHILDISLNQLESRLDPKLFARAHRNKIAALKHVRSLGGSVEPLLEFLSGERIVVSRAGRSTIKRALAAL